MEIMEKEAFSIVGIEVVATWQELHKVMPIQWGIFQRRLHEIQNQTSDKMMDISLKVEEGIYTQVICAAVDKWGQVPDGMVKHSIPKQTYIHFVHEGPLQAIAQSFGNMLQWAEEQKLKVHDFKIDYGYQSHGKETMHDLYVKIAE